MIYLKNFMLRGLKLATINFDFIIKKIYIYLSFGNY